jgi:hypothetical protein
MPSMWQKLRNLFPESKGQVRFKSYSQEVAQTLSRKEFVEI